jgi:diaminohydroxyphosphoribosylaminopyrimidine deaminase/5-amino-6-(5-phosphoribosylamino)uracil reductase
MTRALQLAARGLNGTPPNPRVGCVIAQGETVAGEGWHRQAGGPHAEVDALQAAGDNARGATAYVTLEPCCHQGRTPPCSEALIKAGIRRVVYAAQDPNPQVNGGGGKALLAAGVEVSSGLLAAESERLNAGFFMRMRRGRPLVRCKVAVSLDGRTALADGRSQWITAEPARLDVQRLRAQSSAVLTGIGTVLADDPQLNVRELRDEVNRQPLRVILDSAFKTPPDARLLSVPGEVLVFGAGSTERKVVLEARGARVEVLACTEGRVSLAAVMRRLAGLHINELLVEAGPVLNGALLTAGLVDELIVYQAAHVLGSTARGMFEIPPLQAMGERPGFELLDARRVGADLRLTYRPARTEKGTG